MILNPTDNYLLSITDRAGNESHISVTIEVLTIHDPAPVGEQTKWNYTLDDANDTITLNYYTGTDKDVTVYPQYVVDGKEYKTKIKNNSGTKYMFANNTTVKSIVFQKGIDTSNTINMFNMFRDCSSLTSLDLSNLDTSNCTNMSYMFRGCSSLTSLDLSNLDTSKVADMSYMFENCLSLTSLDLSSFDTSNVTNMHSMFSTCSSLTFLVLSNCYTSNVTDMYSMFYECSNLTSLDISSFDTSNVTNMNTMFSYCSKIQVIYVNKDIWKTEQASNDMMFYKCGVSEVTYKNAA